MVITTKPALSSRTLWAAIILGLLSLLGTFLNVEVPSAIGGLIAAVMAVLRIVTTGPVADGTPLALDMSLVAALARIDAEPTWHPGAPIVSQLEAAGAIELNPSGNVGWMLTHLGHTILALTNPPPAPPPAGSSSTGAVS